MRKILIFLAICASFLKAESLVNAVAVVVDKEPITLYDISRTMNLQKISQDRALALLINDRIEKAQSKQLGISVSDSEFNTELERFLAQSGQSLAQFKASLKASKQDFSDFEEEFRSQILKRKLYEAVSKGAKLDYSESGARQFYETHLNDFGIYQKIGVIIYSSENLTALEKTISGQRRDARVKIQNALLTPQNADPRLLAYLSSIDINAFSPLSEQENGFITYKVTSKQEPQNVSFDEAKDEIMNAYLTSQRGEFVQDFFEKARAKADIQILRK